MPIPHGLVFSASAIVLTAGCAGVPGTMTTLPPVTVTETSTSTPTLTETTLTKSEAATRYAGFVSDVQVSIQRLNAADEAQDLAKMRTEATGAVPVLRQFLQRLVDTPWPPEVSGMANLETAVGEQITIMERVADANSWPAVRAYQQRFRDTYAAMNVVRAQLAL